MGKLCVGDEVTILGQDGRGWWYGRKQTGKEGWFPVLCADEGSTLQLWCTGGRGLSKHCCCFCRCCCSCFSWSRRLLFASCCWLLAICCLLPLAGCWPQLAAFMLAFTAEQTT